jgi:PAS domain-containing protein
MADLLPFDAIDDLSAEELRQRLRSLRSILETAPVPIAIAHDPDCRYITANRALAELLGVPIDSNISLTPHGADRPAYRIQRHGRDMPADQLPMQQAIAKHMFVSNDIDIVRADGTVAHIQNDVEPLDDNVGGCSPVHSSNVGGSAPGAKQRRSGRDRGLARCRLANRGSRDSIGRIYRR